MVGSSLAQPCVWRKWLPSSVFCKHENNAKNVERHGQLLLGPQGLGVVACWRLSWFWPLVPGGMFGLGSLLSSIWNCNWEYFPSLTNSVHKKKKKDKNKNNKLWRLLARHQLCGCSGRCPGVNELWLSRSHMVVYSSLEEIQEHASSPTSSGSVYKFLFLRCVPEHPILLLKSLQCLPVLLWMKSEPSQPPWYDLGKKW